MGHWTEGSTNNCLRMVMSATSTRLTKAFGTWKIRFGLEENGWLHSPQCISFTPKFSHLTPLPFLHHWKDKKIKKTEKATNSPKSVFGFSSPHHSSMLLPVISDWISLLQIDKTKDNVFCTSQQHMFCTRMQKNPTKPQNQTNRRASISQSCLSAS